LRFRYKYILYFKDSDDDQDVGIIANIDAGLDDDLKLTNQKPKEDESDEEEENN
jgi:hypothetical protein